MAGGGGCRKKEAFRRMFSSFLDEEYDNFTSCRRAENIRCVLMSETWRVSGRVKAVMLLKSILMTGWFASPISLSPTTWSFLGSSVLHLCAPQVNSLSSSGILFVHLSAFKICDLIMSRILPLLVPSSDGAEESGAQGCMSGCIYSLLGLFTEGLLWARPCGHKDGHVRAALSSRAPHHVGSRSREAPEYCETDTQAEHEGARDGQRVTLEGCEMFISLTGFQHLSVAVS